MEKTMLDLVKICHHKQFLCTHDNIDDLIKSALDSKLLSINSINSQRLDKKEQEVKIVEEQPVEHRNHAENECEVALEDKRECDLLISKNSPVYNHSDTFSDSKIDDDISVYDDDFEDIEYVEASLVDPEIVSIEEENELLIDDSIISHELSDDNFEDNSSISRPPPEPLDVESFFDLKPDMIAEEISDKLNEDKCFDPRRGINVSTKIEDDDYFLFMFVIRFFLSYFIFPEVSPLLLFAESEDTIFDSGFFQIMKTRACFQSDSEDDGNGEEDQGLRISEEERLNEEEDANELYRDVDINQGRGIQLSQDMEDSHVTLTPVNPDAISHAPIPPTTIPSEVLQNLPTFDSVFRFDDRLKSLEANFSEYIQKNPFAEVISNILGIVHQYMNQQMNEAVRVAVHIQTDQLHDSYQREIDEFPRTIDENMKRIIKEQVKGRSTTGSKSRQVSTSESDFVEKPPTLDHDWNKTLPAIQGSTQTWIGELAKQANSCSSFNELLDTPLDFSNFIMHRLRVDTLTPELLAGPTYELMMGSCTSLIELEYHLEEVYKAT
nr:hypothetical protein [Tanacetum cinerariifolium]